MAVTVPFRPAAGPRSDIRLLDAATVHVHLCKRTSITIGAKRPQLHIAAGDDRLEPSLCSVAAGLIQLCRVDVGEPHLAVIAHQSIAINRETALARCGGKGEEQNAKDESAGHAAITH